MEHVFHKRHIQNVLMAAIVQQQRLGVGRVEVTTMYAAFHYASQFNQDLSAAWNIPCVTDMGWMFSRLLTRICRHGACRE